MRGGADRLRDDRHILIGGVAALPVVCPATLRGENPVRAVCMRDLPEPSMIAGLAQTPRRQGR